MCVMMAYRYSLAYGLIHVRVVHLFFDFSKLETRFVWKLTDMLLIAFTNNKTQ